MMSRETLDAIHEAIQTHVNSLNEPGEPAAVLLNSTIAYETLSYDEKGDVHYRCSYAVPTQTTSLSSCIGLLAAALDTVQVQTRGDDDD